MIIFLAPENKITNQCCCFKFGFINYRIERLWRDVHYGCLAAFRRVFFDLEDSGELEMDNPKHIAILQYVFIPRIRHSLTEFRHAWNHHPLSTDRGRSPTQLMVTSLPPEDLDLFHYPAPVIYGFNDFLSYQLIRFMLLTYYQANQ